MSARYAVGDRLWLYDRNRRSGPQQVEVVKVGRKLVYAADPLRPERWLRFFLDTGIMADGYGHARLVTDEERRREEHEDTLWAALRGIGLERKFGASLPLDLLERLAAAIPAPEKRVAS